MGGTGACPHRSLHRLRAALGAVSRLLTWLPASRGIGASAGAGALRATRDSAEPASMARGAGRWIGRGAG